MDKSERDLFIDLIAAVLTVATWSGDDKATEDNVLKSWMNLRDEVQQTIMAESGE